MPAEFFNIDSSELVEKFWSNSPTRCEHTIAELSARYRLAGRHVLSIGGGGGIQEHYLLVNGVASATIVEPDLKGNLRRHFAQAQPGNLRYVVIDAAEWEPDQPFDVLLVSGYDADEGRRYELAVKNHPWPAGLDPFHPAVARHADALSDAGLLIVQIASGGVDVRYNPEFLDACRRQLIDHGLQLFEAYRFEQTAGIMLLVAVKGEAIPLLGPALTTFNGRAPAEPIVSIALPDIRRQGFLDWLSARTRRGYN